MFAGKKKVLMVVCAFALLFAALPVAAAAASTYTVVPGDSMWKIAVRYEMQRSGVTAEEVTGYV